MKLILLCGAALVGLSSLACAQSPAPSTGKHLVILKTDDMTGKKPQWVNFFELIKGVGIW